MRDYTTMVSRGRRVTRERAERRSRWLAAYLSGMTEAQASAATGLDWEKSRRGWMQVPTFRWDYLHEFWSRGKRAAEGPGGWASMPEEQRPFRVADSRNAFVQLERLGPRPPEPVAVAQPAQQAAPAEEFDL